jgi:hypothetical protein
MDDSYLSSTGIHSIWPTFGTYLADYFVWGDPVLRIVERAHSRLGLRANPNADVGEPFMALHLRRGEYNPTLASRGGWLLS